MNNSKQHILYKRAKARVKREKSFYSHVTVYVIINVLLLILRSNVFDFFTMNNSSQSFQDWFHWNIFITPIFWGIGLVFHGLSVFGRGTVFSKAWEERKIKEYMDRPDF
ncbi:2TM domain-containing protein [Aquimarina sp. W85]|uniref:2TM domain-containing protein n=1 Tax=Aquimarina rhodophyticola TaxID=3342246 RepID=UPI00366BF9F4